MQPRETLKELFHQIVSIKIRQAARQERPAYETKRDFKRVIPSNSVN